MASITKTDIFKLVSDMLNFYMPCVQKGSEGECRMREACGKTNPAQMALLLARLKDYTKRVKAAANEYKLATEWTDPVTGAKKTTGSKYNPQWAVDMGNWEQRLAHYQRVVDSVPEDQMQTKSGCILIYKQVTAPLLNGIWYEALPGIMLDDDSKDRIGTGEGHPQTDTATVVDGKDHPPGHSTAKPPDVISPFTLGNQVLVFKESQDEAVRLFWSDLKESALSLPKRIADAAAAAANKVGRDFLLPLGVALLGVSAVVVTGMAIVNRRKTKQLAREMDRSRELNPRKRLRKLAS